MDLLHEREVVDLLRYGSAAARLPRWMRLHAIYHPPCQPEDYAIECFWLCVYDLSPSQCHLLLDTLFPASHDEEEQDYLDHLLQQDSTTTSSTTSIHILPPPPTSDHHGMDIIVSPEQHGLIIPSYPSLAAAHRGVRRLLDRLSSPPPPATTTTTPSSS
eukprot:scaffold2831_cov249-Ochromonas_danica.AAC.42